MTKKQHNSNKLKYLENKDFISIMKNIWTFLWKDDSVWSWLANIVVAYFFIVFIFYPVLGLVFNTTHPLVAVVSGSMEHMVIDHRGNPPNMCGQKFAEKDIFLNFNKYWNICGSWYEEKYNISKEKFSEFYFKNGFNKGDIIFIFGIKPEKIKIGDVIVFRSRLMSEPIIHRVIDIKMINNELIFTTKGDHNGDSGSIDNLIRSSNIIGKGIFRVPLLGWFKIWVSGLIGR